MDCSISSVHGLTMNNFPAKWDDPCSWSDFLSSSNEKLKTKAFVPWIEIATYDLGFQTFLISSSNTWKEDLRPAKNPITSFSHSLVCSWKFLEDNPTPLFYAISIVYWCSKDPSSEWRFEIWYRRPVQSTTNFLRNVTRDRKQKREIKAR